MAGKATPRPESRKPGSNGARKPTDADLETLLRWIADGDEPPQKRSVKAAIRNLGLDSGATFDRLAEEAWATRYARAKEARGVSFDSEFFGLLEEVKSGALEPAAARVVVDGYKWAMARISHRDWGDKQNVDLTTGGDKLPAVTISPTAAKL